MTVNDLHRFITIDLNQFKLHIDLKNRIELTLHFNSPSRRFYLSVIALVVNEMKRLGKITSIPLEPHLDLLALLNETIGGSAGSSEMENLLPRIYRKWQHALPNLEEAPLFKVLGRRKEYDEGTGKTYHLTETEKDFWANLFEYKGSEENVRLKFAIDKIGAGLDDVDILYEDSINGDAWEKFVSNLKEKRGSESETEYVKEVQGEPGAQLFPRKKSGRARFRRYRWAVLIVAIGLVLGGVSIAFLERYSQYGPQPKVTHEEKITSLQQEKSLAATAHLTDVPIREKKNAEVAPKEKVAPPSPEKVSKTVTSTLPKLEVASKEKMAFPLPDKPSIAVLPFVNISEDPRQEFLGDGITENIITALSKIPRLFVISRQSTLFYKGKPVKVNQVSQELGVQYVLEGSVQKSANRIRISAQLIDAFTGYHVWSERYDCDMKDLFALQDEITLRILTAIRVKLTDGEQASIAEKHFRGKHGLDCYLKLIEGIGYVQRWNIEDNNLGRRMIEEAIAMCPDNPLGYLNLAWAYHHDYWLDNTKSPQTIEKSMELAQKALTMDDSIPGTHALLCQLYTTRGEYDKAIAEGERALALNPSGTDALSEYAWSLNVAGRSEEAIPLFEKVIRLNPFGKFTLYRGLGLALMNIGRFEEAVSAFKKAIQGSPNDIMSHLNLAATYSKMGREEEARAEAAEVLRINPKFSLDNFAKKLPPSKDQPHRDEYINALRKAGLK